MDGEEKKTPAAPPAQEPAAPQTAEDPPRKDRSQLNAFENFYEHFRKVPLHYIDIFIGVCAVALVAVIVLGLLNR